MSKLGLFPVTTVATLNIAANLLQKCLPRKTSPGASAPRAPRREGEALRSAARGGGRRAGSGSRGPRRGARRAAGGGRGGASWKAGSAALAGRRAELRC